MKKTLALLLLALAPFALAEPPRPAAFPDDYEPHPCTAGMACASMDSHQVGEFAALRGWDVSQEWVEKHWNELIEAMQPYCAKAATCYAIQGNHWTFCNDVVSRDVQKICDRFDNGSGDQLTCRMVVRVVFGGHDVNSQKLWSQVKECADAPNYNLRKLEVWMSPEPFDPAVAGRHTVFALDAETHVPVQALVQIEGQKLITSDVPDGRPTSWYEFTWKPAFLDAPRVEGKRVLTVPKMTVTAAGYETVTLDLPIPEPKLVVKMTPQKLRTGENRITITAVDAATGAPAEMRVMAGDRVLGNTNQPLTLKLERGKKRPEIWLTSLFNRYGDLVVLPAQK
jgi:hypothetical protein